MTGKDLLKAMGLIDRKFVSEAEEQPQPKPPVWKTAAGLALLVLVAVVCIGIYRRV